MSDGVENVTNDLMDGLIRMKDEEGKELSDTEVLDNIVSLVIAGYESTSLAIMWSLYYLAKYPNVLQKLRVSYQNLPLNQFFNCFLSIKIDKIDQNLTAQHAWLQDENACLHKHKNGEPITSDDIATLKYTNKVEKTHDNLSQLVAGASSEL